MTLFGIMAGHNTSILFKTLVVIVNFELNYLIVFNRCSFHSYLIKPCSDSIVVIRL